MRRIFEQPKPTDCQIAILEEIVSGNSIEAISYYHPERAVVNGKVEKGRLEKVTKKYGHNKIIIALNSLSDSRVLSLEPKLRYKFEKCWYKVVDLEKAEKLYNSIK